MLDDDSLSAENLTIEQANDMEAELLADVDYNAQEDGYPIVDTTQTEFYSNDAVLDNLPKENHSTDKMLPTKEINPVIPTIPMER